MVAVNKQKEEEEPADGEEREPAARRPASSWSGQGSPPEVHAA